MAIGDLHNHVWHKRSWKGKADFNKSDTGIICMHTLNNILVKWIRLKSLSKSTLHMLFNFYLYLHRIC